MSDKWSRCSLRISSDKRSCESISKVLKAEPSSAANRGDPTSKHAPASGVRELSSWILESGVGTTQSLEEHLGALLPFVEAHAEGLQQLAEDCKLEIFCGFSSGNGQGGFVIEHDLLRRIGEVGLDIVLDLYPPEREE